VGLGELSLAVAAGVVGDSKRSIVIGTQATNVDKSVPAISILGKIFILSPYIGEGGFPLPLCEK
jgi:hypothetical protein